ncbi:MULTISPECIES: hypothetical protein [unclassified Arenibacter]|uniref:hypothetical protein n=1 Tax=unclassified Arenibacter TaxID=2615047 RepID=UPI000852C281|nr:MULTISPECIES: hypothetical protein [unclassified Arenibacter]MCK0135441.1 hypothetical protein [Arenibacter sp. S6351L]MCM4162598.1 hypothetical protein [Arenibacter sp. A80]RFT58174.1 hypothetical protein D0S24_03215 [Arenibacter sp. P308M17]GBF21835.1 hypothetical protein C21_04024 [Arenibacter sp. NBRC 103722]|tara:strand:+ start:2026 stop:2610 length:585 start_codon:yes stop_codon:yes gene_type:complete
MVKYVIVTLFFLIFGNFSNYILAQEKYERESRLKQKYVPSNALNFIDSLSLKNKVKWYLEEGFESKSIEAKFKRNGEKHSIEFDIHGIIQDVEIEMKWNDLYMPFKNLIIKQLKEDCIKHKIVKTQIQYTGNQTALLLKLLSDVSVKDLTVKYEIILKCHCDKNTQLFEYLFNDNGQLIMATPIIFKPSNHLEY